MIMSNFGTTVVSVKKEDISIIACWGQNLNLVDDSLSRFDRQVIEEQTCKGNPQNATHMMSEYFPSSTFWIPTLFLKLAFKRWSVNCVSRVTRVLLSPHDRSRFRILCFFSFYQFSSLTVFMFNIRGRNWSPLNNTPAVYSLVWLVGINLNSKSDVTCWYIPQIGLEVRLRWNCECIPDILVLLKFLFAIGLGFTFCRWLDLRICFAKQRISGAHFHPITAPLLSPQPYIAAH